MKPELLETLLLDRALGELAPEVAALLDAHLAQHPDAAHRATELAATLSLAHTATATPAAAPHRPLDVTRLRHTYRAQHSATRPFELLRLAACLALGLGLGWLARTPPPYVEIAAALPHHAPLAAPAPTPAAESPTGFWSVARLVAEEQAQPGSNDRSESRYELRWTSPTKLPHLKDKL